MPKNKSHSGMGKRIRVTGGGKLVRERAGRRAGAAFASTPIKPSRHKRRLAGTVEVSKADSRRARKLLGR